jgi:predicted NACHT family NTPase
VSGYNDNDNVRLHSVSKPVFPVANTEFHGMQIERSLRGTITYGHPLHTFIRRSVHRDIKEELVDAYNYTVQSEMEWQAVVEAAEYLMSLIEEDWDEDVRGAVESLRTLIALTKPEGR